ncbi:hypothetical protein [Arenibacter certesii]|nr:hypothetical protein [Arenibacter certesii]
MQADFCFHNLVLMKGELTPIGSLEQKIGELDGTASGHRGR